MKVVAFLENCLQGIITIAGVIDPMFLSFAIISFLLFQLLRARAWQNVLQAAFGNTPEYKTIAATYLIGTGTNMIIPAHAGDALKLFLARRELERSEKNTNASYPALLSTLISLTVFDLLLALLLLPVAIHFGLLAGFPLPTLAWPWVALLIIFSMILLLGCSRLSWVRKTGRKLLQGFNILRSPREYIHKVVSWQLLSSICQFFGFFCLLQAFSIAGTFENVFLVIMVQTLATAIPIMPGGAGAQQALLLGGLSGSSQAILIYSVSAQIVLTATAVVASLLALYFVFQTLDWKTLRQQAKLDLSTQVETPSPN